MLNDSVIAVITSRLEDVAGLTQIILFGSQARGVADAHSDIDLIVVINSFEDRYETARICRKKLSGLEYAFDIIVMTPEEYELDAQIPGTISRYAHKEGRTLYAA